MWDIIKEYIIVIGITMFKFIGGPIMGKVYGLSVTETILLTTGGMMLSVILFTTLLGNVFHKWVLKTFYKKRKLFSKRTRRTVQLWKSFGLIGIAFLTPLLFTPIGGTMVATSFGGSKKKIFLYMFISAIFWASVFTIALSVFNLNIRHL